MAKAPPLSSPTPKRVLGIFHSLTGQTRAVMEIIAQALREDGHVVDLVSVVPLGDRYTVPYHKGRFFWEWARAWMGARLRVEVARVDLPLEPEAYDLVMIGHQPWYLDTAIPMASWLETEQASVLAGKPVVSVITARTMWQRAYSRVAQRVEALGGKMVDSFVLRNLVPMPQNMPLTLHYLFEGHDPEAGPLTRLGRFGVGDSGFEAARVWGGTLSLRLLHDRMDDTLTHTEGNRQGLLRGQARRELQGWRRNDTQPDDVDS